MIRETDLKAVNLLRNISSDSKIIESKEKKQAISDAIVMIDDTTRYNDYNINSLEIPKQTNDIEEFNDIIRRIRLPFDEFMKGYANKNMAVLHIENMPDIIITVLNKNDKAIIECFRVELFKYGCEDNTAFSTLNVFYDNDKVQIPLMLLKQLCYIINNDSVNSCFLGVGENGLNIEAVTISLYNYNYLNSRYRQFTDQDI